MSDYSLRINSILDLNARRADHQGLLIPQADQLYLDRAAANVSELFLSVTAENSVLRFPRPMWASRKSMNWSHELHGPVLSQMHPTKNCKFLHFFASALHFSFRNENRVCFADTVSVSKLAQILREQGLKLTSTIDEIEQVIEEHTTNVTHREHRRQVDGREYWFHRLLLDEHIQFPVAINAESFQARRLAYRNLVDVCLNPGGVKMKMLIGDRVKVVKGSTFKAQHDHSVGDFDVNGKTFCLANHSFVHGLCSSSNLHLHGWSQLFIPLQSLLNQWTSLPCSSTKVYSNELNSNKSF